MIAGVTFIVFSDDWGRHPFSCQHLMSQFLPNNKILWVNTIGLRAPKLSKYDLKRSIEKILDWTKRFFGLSINDNSEFNRNLKIIAPFALPYNNFNLLRKVNRFFLRAHLKKTLQEIDSHSRILITTLPNACDILGELGEIASIYYCVDELSEWHGMARQVVENMERDLLEKVDLVVATSEPLRMRKSNSIRETKLLTHGVDVEHFSKSTRNTSSSRYLMNLPHPVIGYYGLIDQRLDQDIVLNVLKLNPELHVVFIGNSLIPLNQFQAYSNFHWLGPIPYEKLPDYVTHFDICILPYVINACTWNINPLKLKEYLATGKPIVATPLPEINRLSNFIKVAKGVPSFIEAIRQCVRSPVDESIDRIEYLKEESWQRKAQVFSDFISVVLREKGTKLGRSPNCGHSL